MGGVSVPLMTVYDLELISAHCTLGLEWTLENHHLFPDTGCLSISHVHFGSYCQNTDFLVHYVNFFYLSLTCLGKGHVIPSCSWPGPRNTRGTSGKLFLILFFRRGPDKH